MDLTVKRNWNYIHPDDCGNPLAIADIDDVILFVSKKGKVEDPVGFITGHSTFKLK